MILVPLQYGSMHLPVLISSADLVLLSSRTFHVKFLAHIVVATNCNFLDYVARCLSSRVVSHLKCHYQDQSRAYARESRTPPEPVMGNAVAIRLCSGQRHFDESCDSLGTSRKQDVTWMKSELFYSLRVLQTCGLRGWEPGSMGNTLKVDSAP